MATIDLASIVSRAQAHAQAQRLSDTNATIAKQQLTIDVQSRAINCLQRFVENYAHYANVSEVEKFYDEATEILAQIEGII